MRRRTLVITAAATALVVGGSCIGVVAMATESPASAGSAGSSVATATAPVLRGDLVDSTLYPGTLGYGSPETLVAAASGTITSVAAFGSVVKLGETLYTVDERPVVALHGRLPVYRAMSWGMTGGDVQQLNASLRALGDTAVPASNEFTRETARAVSAWQRAHGYAATGVIGADQIAFVPGDVKIASVTAPAGSSASGPILEYTSTTRVVTSTVTARQASAFAIGRRVEVGLPDGTKVAAKVSAQSSRSEPEPSTGGSSTDSTVDVTMKVGSALENAETGEQAVDVLVPGASKKDVLSVPVAALVVDPKGGYEVETRSSSGRTHLRVKVGLFAQGRVEVSGKGIVKGMKVVVPA